MIRTLYIFMKSINFFYSKVKTLHLFLLFKYLRVCGEFWDIHFFKTQIIILLETWLKKLKFLRVSKLWDDRNWLTLKLEWFNYSSWKNWRTKSKIIQTRKVKSIWLNLWNFKRWNGVLNTFLLAYNFIQNYYLIF